MLLVGCSVVLLCLDHMSSEHLWILNFYLRVVEDVVVVVDILDYLYWLLLCLLLGL